ncbi:MAG: glycosyltransferase family 2 protein [Oceanidesulfovibrio sp.]
MFNDKKVVVVMPAYNAELTIEKTHAECMAQGVVDQVIVVDDCSKDATVSVAKNLKDTLVHKHETNKGYGGNQKTCYRLALEHGADIVIMVHPDYQYTPKLIPAMTTLIGNELYDCVLASRILGGYALRGGMPLYKYVANRFLTFAENLLIGAKLSEYHTGYRAFSRHLLETLDLSTASNDFVFDNQMLAQILFAGFEVAEVSCPTRYEPDSSSINFKRSCIYGLGCLRTGWDYRLTKLGFKEHPLFPPDLKKRKDPSCKI